jgi:hypothetical protein
LRSANSDRAKENALSNGNSCPPVGSDEKCTPPGSTGSECCGESGPAKSGKVDTTAFLTGWADTPAGPVPRVKTDLAVRDIWGRWRMRWGIGRRRYRIEPGLYAVGTPGADSPVLVTANYKMTFDALRRELGGLDAWILVLETDGINVWCAAGKGTFGTEEVVRRVNTTRLAEVVDHGRLILPQLGATGVAAHRVREECGFSVVYGPVRARDIRRFLDQGMVATPEMRRVSFPLFERLALTPVELVGFLKPSAWALPALFLLAGVGPGGFSPSAAWHRGLCSSGVWLAGILGGAVVTPVLLPWLPGRAFSGKGGLVGGFIGACTVAVWWGGFGLLQGLALLTGLSAISSFAAMNYTGATPFTSPSGVECEMRRAIPLQAAAAALAGVLWIGSAFAG